MKAAKGITDNHNDIDFVFADINCNLVLRKKDNSLKYFNSMSELNGILNLDNQKGAANWNDN